MGKGGKMRERCNGRMQDLGRQADSDTDIPSCVVRYVTGVTIVCLKEKYKVNFFYIFYERGRGTHTEESESGKCI